MIQVRGLTKVFPGGPKAVDGLDLSVSQGEIFGLLGPNGAGKTTAIRTLSTLCGFDSGEVHVAGFDVDREPAKVRQAIGVVAQNTGIDYFLTGRENLELQGHLYRMKTAEIKSRVAELASYFELEGSLDRQVATYSGGMRRKLDIATALIHHPKLVFLDEPTLGLDIKSRKILWTYIEKLNKEMGLTILLTTHYLEEADKLAHRVAIINSGKIRAVGTPDELKSSIAGDALTISVEQQDWAVQQYVHALKQTNYVRDSLWEGNKLHLYITNGAESVPKITEMAGQFSVHILTLSLSRPSLDDVFLKYTGSSLDDIGEGSADEWWKQWAGKGGGKWQKKWAETQGEEGGEASGWGQWSADEIAEWQKQQGQTSAEPSSDSGATNTGNTGGWGQWSAEEAAEWHRQQAQAAAGTKDSQSDDTAQGGGWGQWSAEEVAQWQRQQGLAPAEPEAKPENPSSRSGGWGQWSAEEIAAWHRQRNQSAGDERQTAAEQDPTPSREWNGDEAGQEWPSRQKK